MKFRRHYFTRLGLAAAAFLFGLIEAEASRGRPSQSNHQHKQQASSHHRKLENNAKAAQNHSRSAAQSSLHHNQLEQEFKKHRRLRFRLSHGAASGTTTQSPTGSAGAGAKSSSGNNTTK